MRIEFDFSFWYRVSFQRVFECSAFNCLYLKPLDSASQI